MSTSQLILKFLQHGNTNILTRKKYIDTIMCQQNESEYITAANTQPYNIIYDSDHISMYIDINLKSFIT